MKKAVESKEIVVRLPESSGIRITEIPLSISISVAPKRNRITLSPRNTDGRVHIQQRNVDINKYPAVAEKLEDLISSIQVCAAEIYSEPGDVGEE